MFIWSLKDCVIVVLEVFVGVKLVSFCGIVLVNLVLDVCMSVRVVVFVLLLNRFVRNLLLLFKLMFRVLVLDVFMLIKILYCLSGDISRVVVLIVLGRKFLLDVIIVIGLVFIDSLRKCVL